MFPKFWTRWLARINRSSTHAGMLPLRRSRVSLGVETLEDRVVPAVDFTAAAVELDAKLAGLDSALGNVGTVTDLPVVNKPLADISAAANTFKTIANVLVPAVDDLAGATDASAIQIALTQALDTAHMLDGVTDGVVVNSLTDTSIDLTLHLRRDTANATVVDQADFGLGLPGVPFRVTSADDVDVRTGFEYTNFRFTATTTGGVTTVTLDTAAQDEFKVTVDAVVRDTSVTAMTGVLGFLELKKITDPNGATNFHGDIVMDVTSNVVPLANPRLTGLASVNLHLDTAAGADEMSFPDLTSNLNMTWNFNSTMIDVPLAQFGQLPQISLDDVQLNVGSFLMSMVRPHLDKLGLALGTVQPDIEKLLQPLPVVSDLMGNTSLVDLAVGLGGVPPEVYEYIDLFQAVATVSTNIAALDIALSQIHANIGSFSFGGEDLRTLDPVNFAAPDSLTDLGLAFIPGASNPTSFAEIRAQILGDITDPTVQSATAAVLDFIDPAVNTAITVDLPLLTDPGSVLPSLLGGRDVDLVHIGANFAIDHHDGFGPFPVPLGIGIVILDLDSDVTLNAQIGIGYDTRGLRHYMFDLMQPIPSSHPEYFLEGFYIDPTTSVTIDVTIGGWAIGNIGLFAIAYADGEVSGHLSLSVPAGSDGDGDGKSRLGELGDYLFNVSGQLTAELEVYAAVSLWMFGFPIVYADTFHIPHTVIIDWTGGLIPNPFNDQTPNLATDQWTDSTIPAGELWLNIGSRGTERGPNAGRNPATGLPLENEVYTITMTQDGKVKVSAFGLSEEFTGITKIIGDAGTGNDVIIIGEDVTADVELHGGDLNDQLTANGSGTAVLYGDTGNDVLFAGSGDAWLYGGFGNDQLQGGSGTNTFEGGFGDDLILGGEGINFVSAGSGNDVVHAGPQSDLIDGGGGDDQILGRGGNDLLLGSSGNDTITWEVAAGETVTVTVDGGVADDDTFTLFATNENDTITVSPEGVGAVVLAPGTTVHVTNIESLNVEAEGGADAVTINYLTGIHNVGVNLSDALDPDGQVDLVVYNGLPVTDDTTIEQESAFVYQDGAETPQYVGGIMKISDKEGFVVRTTNILDDLRVYLHGASDIATVKSITGPTKVYTNDGNDIINVLANNYYLAELDIDAGAGVNKLSVSEAGSIFADTFDVTSTRITSGQLPAVNYIATGGTYGLGVSVTTGIANDVVNVRNTLPGLTTSVNTGVGDDRVNVSSNAPINTGNLDGIRGTLSVNLGSGANNVLTLSDVAATTGNQDVKILPTQVLNFAGPGDASTVNFQATAGQMTLALRGSNTSALAEQFTVSGPLASLHLHGNAGVDTVRVEVLSQPAIVNTGDGNDDIRVGDSANTLNSLIGPLTIDGGTGNDTADVTDTGVATGQTYSLGAGTLNRSGAGLITHAGLESLVVTAGSFADQFTVTAAQGQPTILRGAAGSDSLRTQSGENVWQFTGSQSGSLNGTVAFSGIEQARGGSGDDRFVPSATVTFTGSVAGGSGYDTLDYSAFTGNVLVNLLTGAATRLGSVSQIEQVLGGTGDDILLGDNNNNYLVGGSGHDILLGYGGNDHLYGDDGRDILIGGVGADRLYGGAGDDILIGGYTTYDTGGAHGGADRAALEAIQAEWTRTDLSYELRMKHLLLGGGLNGSYRLTTATVAPDADIDRLLGQDDLDWFWALSPIDLHDADVGEAIR